MFDNIIQNISHEWAEVMGESLDFDNEHVVDKCINGLMPVKAFTQWLTICNTEVFAKPFTNWSEDTGYNKKEIIDEWESICLLYKLPRNPLVQDFHLLFINRAFHLNNIIAKYRDISSNCTFCRLVPETYVHLFYDCTLVKPIWLQLQDFFKCNLGASELFTKKNCLLSTFNTSIVSLMSILVKRRIFLDKINNVIVKFFRVLDDTKRVKRCHYLKVKNYKNQLKHYHQFWSVLENNSLFDDDIKFAQSGDY